MEFESSDKYLLNLPKELNFGSNRKINYFYNFDGEKQRQTVENNGTLTKIDYCGPFVYETASGVRSLKFIITPEGRAVKTGTTWDYEYYLKDHLGNVRTVIHKGSKGLAEVIQEKHYYPSGLEMSSLSLGNSTNKYLYNGKEYQKDLGLGWYDYGARFYDPAIGRWHVIDNKAEKYAGSTPYAYALNNPILFLDPDGNEVWKSIKNNADGTRTVTLNFDIRVNNSGGYSSDQIKGWSGKIASQIESSFSGKSSDGKTTYVAKANMDLSGKDNGNNYTMDFVPDVKDENGKSTVNYGKMDGEFGDTKTNNMQIKAPGEDNGAYKEQTEDGVGRTGAHEVGHTGNLYHPTDKANKLEGTNVDGNLMHPSWNPKAGRDLKPNQLNEFSKHVQEKKPDYLK